MTAPAKALSAHQYKQVFEDLGYDLSKLGCIMLDTEPIKVSQYFQETDLYYAKNKVRFWINGVVSEDVPHITLLYGLLRSGEEMKKHVQAVLDYDRYPAQVEIDHVGFFPSPYDDEDYICIVAHLKLTDELIEANERLKFLPHINTFPGYKAHISLAYVRKDASQDYVDKLNTLLAGTIIKTRSLNYGGDK